MTSTTTLLIFSCLHLLFISYTSGQIVRNCGDTINSNYGEINFQFDNATDGGGAEDELCVIVFRAEDWSHIAFSLGPSGSSPFPNNLYIGITTFNGQGDIYEHSVLTRVDQELLLTGAYGIVAFRTGGYNNNNGTAFSLVYEGGLRAGHWYGSDIGFRSESGEFLLSRTSNYSRTPVNIVTITPGRALESSEKVLKLSISDSDFYECDPIQHCDCDALRVHDLPGDLYPNYLGTFCSEDIHQLEYETRSGFILTHMKWSPEEYGSAKLSWSVGPASSSSSSPNIA